MKKFICTLLFLATSWATGWAADKLPSLSDEWNMLMVYYPEGFNHYRTKKIRLTTDTIINDTSYVKLQQGDGYIGALREDNDANIFYIPAQSTHEYLLYAFHAHVGDVLSNLWIGGNPAYHPNIDKITVTDISNTTPRVFTITLDCTYENDYQGQEIIEWIEGIGLMEGPAGSDCIPIDGCCGDAYQTLLCAYKNGEQIYVSEEGEKYGCEYYADPIYIELFNIPNMTEWDGIIGKDKATLADYNPLRSDEAITVLTGHDLMLWEQHYGQKEVQLFSIDNYSLVYSAFFSSSVLVPLNTPGAYIIVMKGDVIQGIIIGRIDFETEQALNNVTYRSSSARKILRNNQILILRGEKSYTLTGQQLK